MQNYYMEKRNNGYRPKKVDALTGDCSAVLLGVDDVMEMRVLAEMYQQPLEGLKLCYLGSMEMCEKNDNELEKGFSRDLTTKPRLLAQNTCLYKR